MARNATAKEVDRINVSVVIAKDTHAERTLTVIPENFPERIAAWIETARARCPKSVHLRTWGGTAGLDTWQDVTDTTPQQYLDALDRAREIAAAKEAAAA